MTKRDSFPPKPEVQTGIYRHYKGGEYEVLMLACDEATHEWLVIYRAVHEARQGTPNIWARRSDSFLEEIEVDGNRIKRFIFLSYDA